MLMEVFGQWWRKGTRIGIRIHPCGLFLAAAFAVTCWAARQTSLDQFYLVAGLRVGALLLVPSRYWVFLILGDYAHLAYVVLPLSDELGIAWSILTPACIMPTIAAIVRLHNSVLLNGSPAWLISLAAIAALAISSINIAMAELLWPVPPDIGILQRLIRYSVGDFLGILTLAPLAFAWRLRHKHAAEVGRVTLISVGAAVAIPVLAVVSVYVRAEQPWLSGSLLFAMGMPAVLLTCFHGWRGAATAVSLVNLVMGITMPSTGQPWSFDSTTFVIQQILAVVGITLLALGSSISHHFNRLRTEVIASSEVISQTRKAHTASELSLRERAADMNRIGEGIDLHLSETADWLIRQGHPRVAENLISTSAFYSRKFRTQASLVYPTALEHVGLYLALQIGGISDVWQSTERILQPRLFGDPCRLPVALQLATYRALTEAVSLLLQCEQGQIRVSARCGRTRLGSGIVVVAAIVDPGHRLSDATTKAVTDRLAGRVLSHGATVECRQNRIRLLLRDT